MWLFWLYEILGLIGVIVVVILFCRWRKISLWAFIKRNYKWIALAIASVWLLIVILCWHHLFDATYCYFRGKSMKANTKYSIFLGECQIETPNGSYIPIEKSRAFLNDNHRNDADDFFGN